MIVTLLFLALLALDCKDEGAEPMPVPVRVKLTLVDVSVKEAFVHIGIVNPAGNETLVLQRNGSPVRSLALVSSDTSITDTGLLENTAYTYRASLQANGTTTSYSNETVARTLTPTSHDFTWQTFVLGDGNSSMLYGVTIINDTLAYAVGDFYLNDSTGHIDTDLYNFATWNGRSWNVQRLYYNYHGQGFLSPIQTIFSIDDRDIWLGGNGLRHWDGQRFSEVELPQSVWGPYNIYGIWGTHGSIYVVGDGGSIATFSNNIWQRIEGGTTTPVVDAWGVVKLGETVVYCVTNRFFPQEGKRILRISSDQRVDTVAGGLDRNLYSIWTHSGASLYACGDGLFRNTGEGWNQIDFGVNVNMNCVRGNRENDIVVVGGFGLLAHYNGATWRVYGIAPSASFYWAAIKGNIIIAVGRYGSRAIAAIGKRIGG
jgi:hypothetical protein